MPITRTAMIDDDGTGTTGTILNNSWKQEWYGQVDAYVGEIGKWSNLATPAGTFTTGGGGTWTVTDATYGGVHLGEYGRTAAVTLNVSASTLAGGSPTSLNIALPSLTATRPGVGTAYVNHGGAWEICAALVFAGQSIWAIQRAPFVGFTAGSIQVYATLLVPLT